MGIYQVQQVQSKTELETKNKHKLQSVTMEIKKNVTTCDAEKEIINPDIIKVQQITGWDLKISTYFVNEANVRDVKIFEEALPIASIESGGTYDFNAVYKNTNGTIDKGLFQINDVTYLGIVKQFKSEGREFKSWDRANPEFNISAGMFWIAYLKDNHQLKGHQLFTSYNRGITGAKQYASRSGSYESRYSREVSKIKNELIKQ